MKLAGCFGGHPQWSNRPTPPVRGKGKGVGATVGLAPIAVIAASIVTTVAVLSPDPAAAHDATPSASNGGLQFASANDTGPTNLITEDPTCEAWSKVTRDHYDQTEAVRWSRRDPNISAASWTPQQRDMYDTVGKSMETVGGQAKHLAKKTPHRVMRRLYEQVTAYASAFRATIPAYVAVDNKTAAVVDALITAAADICAAVKHSSVQTVGPLTNDPPAPTHNTPLDDAEVPQRFLAAGNHVCTDWTTQSIGLATDAAQWRNLDPDVPASEWTPAQKAIKDTAARLMTANADRFEGLGRASGNPVLEDFAVLAAQYWRGFVSALPHYTPADSYLPESATLLSTTVNLACKAAVIG